MADDDEYDPNAGVAPWVNIVIPIISMVIFVVAMVAVYFTPYEIDIKRLDMWAEKIPFMKKKVVPQTQEISTQRKQYRNDSRRPHLHYEVSKISSEKSSMRSNMYQPSYYGSTGTMISFESNV